MIGIQDLDVEDRLSDMWMLRRNEVDGQAGPTPELHHSGTNNIAPLRHKLSMITPSQATTTGYRMPRY